MAERRAECERREAINATHATSILDPIKRRPAASPEEYVKRGMKQNREERGRKREMQDREGAS